MGNEIAKYVESAVSTLKPFNLNNIQNPIAFTSEEELLNSNSPLSFKEWLARNTSINTGNEYKEYNGYLKFWYAYKSKSKKNQLENLRNDYAGFLRELSLVFKDDPQFKYISEIDFDDNLDLEYAIPYFTKKIKEICFYIINKRETTKNAKLKYNMAGSNQALEKLFYQYLLQAFTKRNTLIQVPEFSGRETLPDLSAVATSFRVQVEELNDDGSYFDKDPSAEKETSDWIFDSGTIPLCSDNPFFWTLQQTLDEYDVEEVAYLPFSAVDMSDQISPKANQTNQSLMSRKYAGNDFYLLTGGYYVLDTEQFELNLSPKNNWFYWPSGEKLPEVYDLRGFDAIKINDTSLVQSGATPSNDYRKADRIFVQKGNDVYGAWLRHYLKQTETSVMSCAIGPEQTFEFKFPYCDYGIAGEDTDWAGRGINNIDSGFNILDDDGKKAVEIAYWDYASTTTQICAIPLNETTLVQDGAHSSVMYLSADKISKRKATNQNKVNDSTPDGVYKDGFEYAWLYRFLKTDLPVKVGKNTFQWPVQRVEVDNAGFMKVESDFCSPLALSCIDIGRFLGARSGYVLNDSDIVYKLNTRDGYPVECAYLKGAPISESFPASTVVTGPDDTTYTSMVTGTMQIGLTHKCKPDTPETFIWQDADTPISALNLNYKKHQDDCPFLLFSDHVSLHDQKDLPEFNFSYPWETCECKSVFFSPIGHPGTDFDDYSGMADFVLLDTQDPKPFSLATWRGSDGKNYKNSKDFAWFRIRKQGNSNSEGLDVDVGMGKGEWTTGDGTPFEFKSGKQYKYVRSGLKRTYNELLTNAVPPMIVSEPYGHGKMPAWKKAVLSWNGQWTATDEDSDMVLKAGDYLYYDHYQSNFYCLNYRGTYGEFTVESYDASALNTTNNPWVNYTFATTGIPVKYRWPNAIHNGNSAVPQVQYAAGDLCTVKWSVTMGTSSYVSNLSPEDQLTVVPYQPTNITVTVTGVTLANVSVSASMSPVQIVAPYLTRTVKTSGERQTQTIYADTLNFMLNVPLSGWQYDEPSENGAKPFWGEATDGDVYSTKFKGVREWGYGLRVADEYTFIHQPPVSLMKLSAEDALKYEKKNSSIIWKQPVDFIVNDETKEWCELQIDAEKTSPLSSYLYNVDKELVVYPTTAKSNLVLEQYDFINYWSNGEFTWYQELTNSGAGVPPFGGTYVPYGSSLVVETDVPFGNLSNRHYPSMAVYPNVSGFYTDRDTGGYLNHKGLGVLTYFGKNQHNAINPSLTANELPKEHLFFRDPEVFVSDDRGLTGKTQIGPIVNLSNDSSWMKGKITEGNRAGRISGEDDHKEFSPYQTKEETVGVNGNGLLNIDYNLDPWYSEFDDKWRDTINWPPNFRQEYPIKQWNANQNVFLENQRKTTQSATITLMEPYIREDVESRNAVEKVFIGTAALGAGVVTHKHSFSAVEILDAGLSVVPASGLVLRVNSSPYKNFYVPILSSTNLATLDGNYADVVYGDRRQDDYAQSYGHIELSINDQSLYVPLYRTSKTAFDATNLSGVTVRDGTFSLSGYMVIYMNETEKGLLPLYTIESED